MLNLKEKSILLFSKKDILIKLTQITKLKYFGEYLTLIAKKTTKNQYLFICENEYKST